MKQLVMGILAHVDAGKTTLSESMLYLTGKIRKLGRVDHKDAFLDTYELERVRGITIFSKQAVLNYKDMQIMLQDTPGHVDFSAEMERTLQVLDVAILVISGTDGVQGHTETVWKLLQKYQIPTFLFINKMDLDNLGREAILEELRSRLDDGCMDFSVDVESEEFLENLAMSDELVLEQYMEHGTIERSEIVRLIAERKKFPCYFGSALKLQGIEEFMDGLEAYTKAPEYGTEFGAKIYKIARDDQGSRLTYLKVTGGSLRVKTLLTNRGQVDHSGVPLPESAIWEEKIDQIRIYSGAKYESVEEVQAGMVCAVTGLTKTYPGEGLGAEAASESPVLEPVLTYQILLPADCNVHETLRKLRQLEEEDPQLHIVWNEQLKEIHVQLMGEVQLEVLQSLVKERFGIQIEFSAGSIVYKETIKGIVEGVGHFEPLRHYAEVHLLMEPLEAGSGLQFSSICSEDDLDLNWQRLVLTHLEEKQHVGVLTGSPITDMKITLAAGRAHLKHTEGGDFRQATYRAVRQGLRKAESVLLEPYYDFRIEVPLEAIGRAMSDVQRMCGEFQPPETVGDMAVLTGYAPVATMRDYGVEVTAYTRGRGRLVCNLRGYEPCHNTDEVVAAIGYDCEADLENPTGSVFCAHGSGFLVPWEEVEDYMHLESTLPTKNSGKGWEANQEGEQSQFTQTPGLARQGAEKASTGQASTGQAGTGQPRPTRSATSGSDSWENDKELEAIFARTFGPIKQRPMGGGQSLGYEKPKQATKSKSAPKTYGEKPIYQKDQEELGKEYLLVDGYNIIFAWDNLKELAKDSLEAARNKLMEILCNYQGFRQCILILVFDAYKVKGNLGEIFDYHNIHVVYTKEAETADMYIEKVTHELGRKHRVTVATSDALEQVIILGQGANRLSASGLQEEVERVQTIIHKEYLNQQSKNRNFLLDDFKDIMEK